MTERQKYPKRKSPRLQGFDYSTAQSYHVVLVTQDRAKVFGRVVDSRMLLSKEGRAAADLILEIPRHYTRVSVDESVVMPDHVAYIDQHLCRSGRTRQCKTDGYCAGIQVCGQPTVRQTDLAKELL